MHGGDIYRNQIQMDFSVNISPLGVPDGVQAALASALGQVQAYPDLHCSRLKELLAKRHGVSEERILCGNGASELILAAVHARRPKRAFLAAPGFYGYEHALASADAELVFYEAREENGFELGKGFAEQLLAACPDIVFLANPNNPTGVLADRAFVQNAAEACRHTGALLVIDECFLALTGHEEDVSFVDELAEYAPAIVLKAFTKSFAIPGVRLGYCICSDGQLALKMQRQLPEWNVSVFAQRAGEAALQEQDYLAETVRTVQCERAYLADKLTRMGIFVYPSDANYLLFYDRRDWYALLLQEQILIRDCSDYRGLGKGFYRIAVKSHEENVRLIACMQRLLDAQKKTGYQRIDEV